MGDSNNTPPPGGFFMNSAKQRWRPVLSFFVNNICFTHFSAVLDMVTDIWENAT